MKVVPFDHRTTRRRRQVIGMTLMPGMLLLSNKNPNDNHKKVVVVDHSNEVIGMTLIKTIEDQQPQGAEIEEDPATEAEAIDSAAIEVVAIDSAVTEEEATIEEEVATEEVTIEEEVAIEGEVETEEEATIEEGETGKATREEAVVACLVNGLETRTVTMKGETFEAVYHRRKRTIAKST
jgi:hypothetical protein